MFLQTVITCTKNFQALGVLNVIVMRVAVIAVTMTMMANIKIMGLVLY